MPGEEIRAAIEAALGDPSRVAAAARLLRETGTETSLDRLTALAKRLVGASAVHVAVLTDRLVVVSRQGLPVGELDTGELHGTLCGLTASLSEPLVLEDATTDERAARFPVVRAGEVGAYLGIPLLSREGVVVGSMCAIDPHPHPWTTEQRDALADIAGAVTAELELAAVSAELRETLARQDLVLQAGDVGSFDMDLLTGQITWDERLRTMFGYDAEQSTADLDDMTARVHPDDLDRVQSAITSAIRSAGSYEVEYRVVLPDDGTRWLRNRGRALAGPGRRSVRLIGATYDSTKLREADAQVARILETLPTGFASVTSDFVIGYVNGTAEKILRTSRDRLVGRNVWEAFPSVHPERFRQTYGPALRSGRAVVLEEHYPPLDTWYEIRVWPMDDGFSIYVDDITESRRIAAERRGALAAREEAIAEAERAGHSLRVLAEASAAMGATLDEDLLVELLLDAVVPGLAGWATVRLLRPPSAEHDVVEMVRYRGERDPDAAVTRTATATLLSRDHRPLGTLIAQLPDGDEVVRADQERLLGNLADRASAAIENARLYTTQQRMSEVLQRSMLTRLPEVRDLGIVARYRPTADQAQVGGDWYDAFEQPDGRTVLVIGDVVGHDRHAAAAMGQLRNLLRGLGFDSHVPASELLRGVDRAMHALEVDALATALVAVVEPDSGDGRRTVRWASAGHLPPVVVRGDGTVELLELEDNLLLGVDPGTVRTDQETTLCAADTLLLYTDGLVERRDHSMASALDRLVHCLAEHADGGVRSLEEICDGLLHELVPARPDDDVALIAVRPRRPVGCPGTA